MSSTATHADVLAGRADWSAECADALAFLRALPDDSVDLLFTSPPYRKARTYGIGAGRDTEDWTAWMVEIVKAAAPKVKGLVAVNCEGQTEDYQYHPTPYLLLADLHRLGFNARRPAFFHRVGIPGSGGPDWLRADVEPIICITRPGKLPWSDNTACGHPPRWAPGGGMSHRLTDGTKRNAFGMNGTQNRRNASGERQVLTGPKTKAAKLALGAKRPSSCDASPQENGDALREQAYLPPALANPGNVISCTVGGGQMGHTLSHENEAPFPLELPTFFVLSFCPPGGVVCDPFGGSFTTAHAAVNHGRRFVGCDVRESQVDLGRRRLRSVTPTLFGTEVSS